MRLLTLALLMVATGLVITDSLKKNTSITNAAEHTTQIHSEETNTTDENTNSDPAEESSVEHTEPETQAQSEEAVTEVVAATPEVPVQKAAPKPAPIEPAASATDGFIANVSAYTAAFDETQSGDGITASGRRVRANHTIACPPQYRFGTKIHIDGYGTYTCEDRGGAIKGNKFDIYMETKAEAFSFGRRNLVARVVG